MKRETFMKTLTRKLNELFKENVQLRKDSLRLKWTGTIGKEENADIALCETDRRLESQREPMG